MRHIFNRYVLRPALGLMLLILAGLPSAALAADAAGLVSALTSQLGVTKPQAEGGAGAMFNLAKQRMAPDQFGQVQNSIPGIGDLMSAAPAGEASGGGMGGMASNALGGMMGGGGSGSSAAGGLGSLAPLAGTFSSLGLSPDMASKFVPVVLQYLNSSGGGGAAGLLKGALLG